MAQLNELVEYLYEDSFQVRDHGLDEIIRLAYSRDLDPDEIDQLQRVLVRILDDNGRISGESRVKLLALLIVSEFGRNKTYIRDSTEKKSLVVRSVQAAVMQCSNEQEPMGNVWNLEFILLSLFCETSCHALGNMVDYILRALDQGQPSFHVESCLRLLVYLSCIDDFVSTLMNGINIFERYIGDNLVLGEGDPSSWALLVLYNLSFHDGCLSRFTWDIYWVNIHIPICVRILIHGIQSGKWALSEDEWLERCTDLMYLVLKGKASREYIFLLKIFFSKHNSKPLKKILIYQLFHYSVIREDIDLCRSFLSLPTAWVADRTDSLIPFLSKPLPPDILFVIITLLSRHVEGLASLCPVLQEWLDHKFVSEAFAKESRREMEKIFLACRVGGENIFFEKMIFHAQRFVDQDLKNFVLHQLLVSKEIRSLDLDQVKDILDRTESIQSNVFEELEKLRPDCESLIKQKRFYSW
jgi:hypothetical protein